MRNARKRLSLLLALALVFTLLPQMTLPAQAAEEYNIWIGGVRVDSSNAGDVLGDGTVVFTPASGSEQARLTLNNAAIPGAARPDAPNSTAGIYAGIDLTLELVGSSEITGTDAISSSFGILLDGKTLTVTGSGTLDVTAGDGSYSCAISTNSMIMRSGTIRATAGKASDESEGVYSNSFTMEGGTLVATGSEAPKSWGVGGNAAMNGGVVIAGGQARAFWREPDLSGYADPDVWVNTEPSETGAKEWNGTDALGGDGSSFKYVSIESAGYDVWVGGVRVTEENKADVLGDGTVAFTPATESEQAKLTLNGAEIIGAPVPAWPHDSDGIYSDIDLTLELHGENTVTADNAGEGGDCIGIFTHGYSLVVTGDGILNVTAGEGGLSCGVNTFVMTMRSGTLRVTAGKATEDSDGVYSLSFTMEGGTLITEAGEAPNSRGFDCISTFNGGTIEATGQTSALFAAPKFSDDGDPAVLVNTEPTEIGAKAWNGTDDLSKDGSFKYVKIARYNPFTDVAEGAYYYDAVLWAVEHDPQITKGTDATHFSPDATCTRGQVVTFLWRAAGAPEPTMALNPFSDVKEGAFYYKAVLWAVQTGITKGVDATHFGPDRDCTRGQVVAFLHRAQGTPAPGSSVNPFVDVAEGAFYYDAVLWAVEKNVTKGTSETTFSPDATCTRGQIVTFLYRAMK